MNPEAESIIRAIESLQQESNLFKDYIYPLVSGFFSALLGAGVAYFTLKNQENIQIEKSKMDITNKWTLIAEGAFSSLIALKSNYHGKLESNPFQRMSQVPSILHSSKPIIEEITSLSFIVPKKVDTESHSIKWRSITRIRTMIHNYNFTLDLWNKRNEIERPIKEKILHDHAELGFIDVSREQIFESVGAANYIALIDLTEKAMKFTDDLIIELNDFLTTFPEIGKALINTKKLKEYGSIITFNSESNPMLLNMIDKSPEVDFDVLAKLYGRTVEQVKNEYTTGYEK